MKNALQRYARKLGVSTMIVALTTTTAAISANAAAATGNTDLDGLIDQMESGLGFIKTGGLYVVGAVILIAIVFLGARWVWNMFRGWLAKAQ